MSAVLVDKLRAAKVTHNVNNTRCRLRGLFTRSKHGFWSFECLFAGLPPSQPPILTLHVSNGTPITDQLVFFGAKMRCISKMIHVKLSQNSLQRDNNLGRPVYLRTWGRLWQKFPSNSRCSIFWVIACKSWLFLALFLNQHQPHNNQVVEVLNYNKN